VAGRSAGQRTSTYLHVAAASSPSIGATLPAPSDPMHWVVLEPPWNHTGARRERSFLKLALLLPPHHPTPSLSGGRPLWRNASLSGLLRLRECRRAHESRRPEFPLIHRQTSPRNCATRRRFSVLVPVWFHA